MSRDPALERRLLDRIAALAGRRFGVDCRPYVRAVERRLALAAERYGDDLHDGRDLMAELLEETPDVAGYALLEVQRLAGAAPREVRDDLLRAAVLSGVCSTCSSRESWCSAFVEPLERATISAPCWPEPASVRRRPHHA